MPFLAEPDYETLAALINEIGVDVSRVLEGASVSYRGAHYEFRFHLSGNPVPQTMNVPREWADRFLAAMRPHGETEVAL